MNVNIDKELQATVCTVAAIGGIVVLEIYAMEHGIDGTALAAAAALIAGLGGYKVKSILK